CTRTKAACGPLLGVYTADQRELMPTLARIISRSSGGTTSRIISSISPTWRSVSSTRGPPAARIWTVNSLESTSGKSSWPMWAKAPAGGQPHRRQQDQPGPAPPQPHPQAPFIEAGRPFIKPVEPRRDPVQQQDDRGQRHQDAATGPPKDG